MDNNAKSAYTELVPISRRGGYASTISDNDYRK